MCAGSSRSVVCGCVKNVGRMSRELAWHSAGRFLFDLDFVHVCAQVRKYTRTPLGFVVNISTFEPPLSDENSSKLNFVAYQVHEK